MVQENGQWRADYLSMLEERLGLMVDQEWTYRDNRRLTRHLKEAKLRVSACVEDIDYRHPHGLDRSVVRSLATCDWLRTHQNAIITGPTGVGKSFLACALANAACRQGFSARYYRVPRLLSELTIASQGRRLATQAPEPARPHPPARAGLMPTSG